MLIIIDRFEGDFAVCEEHDGKMVNIERSKLPKNSKEGDVLRIENEIIRIDSDETQKRKKEIEDMVNKLWT